MAKKDKVDISKDAKKEDKKVNEEINSKENKSTEAKDIAEDKVKNSTDNKNEADSSKETKDSKDSKDSNDTKQDDSLKKELENVNNKLVRLQADFLNYKARTEKEKFTTYNSAVEDVLTELLPIIDNFERAIDAVDDKKANQDVVNFKNGIKMIYTQLINTLKKRGLAEIEALDSKFDPKLHSGIAYDVVKDKEEDTIIEVFQKGYTVNDKVIRPSMVKIAKN